MTKSSFVNRNPDNTEPDTANSTRRAHQQPVGEAGFKISPAEVGLVVYLRTYRVYYRNTCHVIIEWSRHTPHIKL